MQRHVTLSALTEEDHAAVRALSVKPFQVVFAGQPADALDQPAQQGALHVIRSGEAVLGLFGTDPTFPRSYTFAPADSIGVNRLIIDQDRQGGGYGRAACRQMRDYLRGLYPLKSAAYMLVHTRNAGAYKAVTQGGWTDTGTQHLLSPSGPQHVLRLALI